MLTSKYEFILFYERRGFTLQVLIPKMLYKGQIPTMPVMKGINPNSAQALL